MKSTPSAHRHALTRTPAERHNEPAAESPTHKRRPLQHGNTHQRHTHTSSLPRPHDRARFHRAPAPSNAELARLLDVLIRRIARTLVRANVLVEDPEQPWLDLRSGSTLEHLAAAEVRYRIALGPIAGRRCRRLTTGLIKILSGLYKIVHSVGKWRHAPTASRLSFSQNCRQ